MGKGEEKEFEVRYPEDFAMKEVAGKTVKFTLKVKDILQRILPGLDDEFAKDLGQENFEGLKNKIREDIAKKLEEQSQKRLKEEIVKFLLEKNTFDVPSSLVEDELIRIKREFLHNLQRHGLDIPHLDQDWEDRFRERALRNVRISIIFSAIAKKEGIRVGEEELNNKLREIAKSYEVPVEKVKEVYQNNNMIPSLEAQLIEEKVFDFLLEKSNIEEVQGDQN
jgi:trigger factor